MNRASLQVAASNLPPSDQTGFASYIYGAKRKKIHISQLQSAKVSTKTAEKPIVAILTEEDEEMMMNEQAAADVEAESTHDVLAPEVDADEDWEDAEAAADATTTEDPVEGSTATGSSSYVLEPEEPRHRAKEPSLAIVKGMSQVRMPPQTHTNEAF